MQVGESIARAVSHEEGENDDCPFCPVERGKKYKTYKGSANDSSKLESIMEDPSTLTTNQPNTCPHSGTQHPTRVQIESRHSHPIYGFYEFQAHHLVSGKQALQEHKMEQWIDHTIGNIDEDSGYTINGSLNGIWAPSWPKSFRNGEYEGEWTTDPIDRQEIANRVMEAEGCQFHLGAHNIGDPKDKGEIKHKRYDNWLKNELTKINLRIWGWSRKCPVCIEDGERKKPPFQPNERVNKALNNLSTIAKEQLTCPREEWIVFISRLALKYHSDVCTHFIQDESQISF